jgi:chromosomal replication initiation ATPase DnaA
MGKIEDFSKVIKVVTELADVTEQDVLGKSRVKEVVDARWMVIYFMKMKGYCTNEISELSRHPNRTVNHALKLLPRRLKLISSDIGNNFELARQQLL